MPAGISFTIADKFLQKFVFEFHAAAYRPQQPAPKAHPLRAKGPLLPQHFFCLAFFAFGKKAPRFCATKTGWQKSAPFLRNKNRVAKKRRLQAWAAD